MEGIVNNETAKSTTIPTEIIGQQDSVALEYFKNPEFVAQYQSLQDRILYTITELGTLDFDLYFSNPEIQQVSDTTAKIMELFLDIYTKYPNGFEDIDEIINHYIQEIEKSNLSSYDKEYLFTGLSVAAYSPRFWADKLEGETISEKSI